MWSLATCALAALVVSYARAYEVPGHNVSISVDDSYQVPKLTIDNYAEMTENKTVFIRFFYNWDYYAKHMESWKRLAKEWDGHAVGLVADVECTTDDGKALCDLYDEVPNQYPTFKYGDPGALDVYRDNNRTYEALSNFAQENLKPVCSVANIDLCDADKKAQIQMYAKLSADELNAAVKTEEEKLTKADEEFKEALAKYCKKLLKDKDATVASVKGGLGLIKYLLAAKSKDEKNEL